MTTFDLEGLTPFQLAISEGSVGCVGQCLRYLPRQILDQSDAALRTPLLLAVATGNQDIIQVIHGHTLTLTHHTHTHTHTHTHSCVMTVSDILQLLILMKCPPIFRTSHC